MRDCWISSVLLFPLVCKLIRWQQLLIGASGSDSLPPLALVLEGGTVGFITGQEDFHQGLAIIMSADPSWHFLEESCLKWVIGNKGCFQEIPHIFYCSCNLLSPLLMYFISLKALPLWKNRVPHLARAKIITKHPSALCGSSHQSSWF